VLPSFLQPWLLGVKSLLLHPLRSLLTVLGIFIGVASVIWLMAIGEGISQQAQKQIADLGADTVIVRTVKPPPESVPPTSRRAITPHGLTRDDFRMIQQTVPTLDKAIPVREIRRQFRRFDRDEDGRLVGCTPEYAALTRLEIDRGHFITELENENMENVCVLSAEVAQKLFPFEDPLDDEEMIRVEDTPYRVVGVLKPKAATAGIGGSFAAQDYSHDVYIPIKTLWDRIGDVIRTSRPGTFEAEIVELSQITMRVKRDANVIEAADLIKAALKSSHKFDDYAVVVPYELLEQAKTTRLMFIVLMGFIAAISLVVGGIGIMNIMLATVTERTREIGIRRALGAKRRDITRQFLIETVALSVVGGLTGIIGGLTAPVLITWIHKGMDHFFPTQWHSLPEIVRNMTPQIVPTSIPLAFGISVAVGVIFGIYPATRAAAMDPIEALRHE